MSAERLQGKIALVTGAGSGIGRAMAELFAQNDCEVAVVDVIPDRVNETVKKITYRVGKGRGYV